MYLHYYHKNSAFWFVCFFGVVFLGVIFVDEPCSFPDIHTKKLNIDIPVYLISKYLVGVSILLF